MNILQINASPRREGANSTKLASQVSERLQASQAGRQRDRARPGRAPHPVLDEAALGALFTPAEQRSPEQAAVVAGTTR
jgi:FMN-dependent NADH-azoreductase